MSVDVPREEKSKALLVALGLEFHHCECNPHKHFVLYEHGSPFHGSYPLYASWVADEQVEHYVGEGLLDSKDEDLCRQGLSKAAEALGLPTLYKGSLPEQEWKALMATKCAKARRPIPAYLID